MIFLSEDLKYHNTTVGVNSNNEGSSLLTESPDAIWETTTSDSTKKKPA